MHDPEPHDPAPEVKAAPAEDRRIDQAVVAALYVEHASELRRFLIGVLRCPEAAEDALQATFVKAVEQGHTAREESLKGWLFRVAYHEALLAKRRQGVRDRAALTLAWGHSNPERRPPLRQPHEPLAERETIERVRVALDELPSEQRQVVRMRIYDEKTFAVIAGELGVPLGTVLTRMRSALEKLRNRLKEP